MKNTNLIFRRTHLYLGMVLLPWLAMYALSTVLFNHGEYFRQFRAQEPFWEPLWEKEYALDVPPDNDALRATALRILADQGMRAAFFAQRQGAQIMINVPNFRQPLRLVYAPEQHKLRAEKRKTTWAEILVRLHNRVGYGDSGVLRNLWAAIVDVFCFGMLAWIATGLFLWWKLPATRGWGFAAIAGGFGTLAILLFSL